MVDERCKRSRIAAFASGSVLSRSLSVLAGPIGWALTAAWTAYDIAGPAYRVIVPAVIQIAYLRQKSLMLELSISPEQDDDDEINESDDE